MKKENTHELKDLLEQLVKAYRWSEKMDEMKVRDSWEKVVGNMIDRHTSELKLKDKTLFVKLDSSALRNELMMARTKIAESINKELGKKIVDDIIFR